MATYVTPARQPFGILDESKLRTLQSVKNRQNAVTPSPAHSLKRRAPSPDNSDSENIDPFHIDLSSKRKRAAFDDDISLAKQPRLETRIISTKVTKTYTPPASLPRHRETPFTTTSTTVAAAPLSAPPAAGRSPTRLHNSRYERPQQSKRRFAPPSFKSSSPSISIAAALRGTLSHKRPVKSRKPAAPVLEDTKPKSWFFDIFEESEEIQDYRMSEWTMTQSSAALEISDDESKGSRLHDNNGGKTTDKGKENIDPNEMVMSSGPVTRSAAAAAASAAVDVTVATEEVTSEKEEPRTPLGSLNASDFYAEGLDATSVVLVHDDSAEEPTTTTTVTAEEQREEQQPLPTTTTNEFTFSAPLDQQLPIENQADIHVDLTHEPIPAWALLQTSHVADIDHQAEEAYIYCETTTGVADADTEPIDIWESESAKGENENENECENDVVDRDQENAGRCIIVGEGERVVLSGI